MRKFFTLIIIVLSLSSQTVSAQCNPAFTFTVNQATASFTATATNPGLQHYWNFGDGYAGTGQTTNHSYNSPGTYNVKHVIHDSLNTCMDSLVQNVTVTTTATCQASFVTSYDSVNYNYGVYCYSTSTYSGTGIQTYTWSVNGVVQGGNNSYLYFTPSPGSNNICLTIVTMAGCTSSYCQVITAPSSCNFNPSFTYTASPVNSRAITFTPAPDQTGLSYFWNFGDGYTSAVKTPVHAFAYPGTYSVKLTVMNTSVNCLDTVRQNVNITAGPNDSCTASYSYTLNNYGLATFTAASNQVITSQSWFIYNLRTGEPDSIFANNPTYQFPDTGYYYVCLTLTTNTGCTRTYCNTINVQSVSGRYAERIPAFPNPVSNGDIKMSLSIGAAGPIEIKVVDASGNVVLRSSQAGQVGTNILKVPADRLKPGMYFVEICYRYKLKRSIFQKL